MNDADELAARGRKKGAGQINRAQLHLRRSAPLCQGEKAVNEMEILSGCSCQCCSGVKCVALPGKGGGRHAVDGFVYIDRRLRVHLMSV